MESVNRKQITKTLSLLTEQYICPYHDTRVYFSKEVTFDYNTNHPVRVDYMKFKPKNNTTSGIEKGDFYCYEIKSCIEDFKSKNGHNFIGDLNYYVMSESLYKEVKSLIPYKIGILVTDLNSPLKVLKPAKRIDRTKSIAEMLLMMFRSSNRENIKNRKWGVVNEEI